ncbi:histidine kinase [Streptococcus didelphis]|uniref:Histidine kinase n=1 Tax=Streptococcus didelphis TaxID=102886 RepID=A0ABY9LFQ3_9STRE|nr:histidine kinase [Streptococcus didelphis]WMB27745.1 histidine kinase [Streptococcus didelphis]
MYLFDYIGVLLTIIVYYIAEITVFSFLSGLQLAFWKKALIISIAVFCKQFGVLCPLMLDPFLLLGVYLSERKVSFSLRTVFLILAPVLFVDLLSRFISMIVIPHLLIINKLTVKCIWINLFSYLLLFPAFIVINLFVGSEYQKIINNNRFTCSYYFVVTSFVFILSYYLNIFMIHGFYDLFLPYRYPNASTELHKLNFFFFTVLLFYLIAYFNKKSKECLEARIRNEQESYITNLENYGKHLEKLYCDVKSFQISYMDCLNQLEEAIQDNNIQKIQEIYANSVKDAQVYWDHKHYNISKLAKLKMSSLKSLLSAKIIEAEKAGLQVSVEVPDTINESYIPVLDFLLLLSIFCDNAIEASLQSNAKKCQ